MITDFIQRNVVGRLPPAVRVTLVILAALATALGLMYYATGGRVARGRAEHPAGVDADGHARKRHPVDRLR